ncbi:TonB family protein [Nitrosomonas nitrosa]|uniref:TonB family protein n=1 Tax=Nitrosomonas nitrosa TaxID=52442 RepID=UPI0023F6F2F2|nr:TonB family protein [Nitrosomonas nitrosa]MCO6432679.1 TonB family protein [Nitrosomonas nitrosa]
MKRFVTFVGLFLSLTGSFFCKNYEKKETDQQKKSIDVPPPDPAPKVIKKPKSIYPSSAINLGDKGKVIVQVTVGIDGTVSNAKTMWSTNKIFETTAESLAYQYVFETPIFDGKPQALIFSIPIIFDPDSIQVEKK